MHTALILALLACTDPDPYGAIEAELGEPLAPEHLEALTDRGQYVLLLPDQLVVGGFGWDRVDVEEQELLRPLAELETLPLERGAFPEEEVRGQLIAPLYDVLLERAEAHKDLGVRVDDETLEFRGRIWLFADLRIRESLLRQVMFTAGQAQYGDFHLLGVGPRLGGGPPPSPEPSFADASHRPHPLSPTRIGQKGGQDAYVIDDRVARVEVDTVEEGASTAMPGEGSLLAELRARPSNPRLYPTYVQAAASARYPILPSVEMLLHVSKHLDDALMAELQRAREPARSAWIDTAIDASDGYPRAEAWLQTAAALGDGEDPAAAAWFLDDPIQSLPVGIYGEHADLGRIFRRDRWLMQDLSNEPELKEQLAAVLTEPEVTSGLKEERAHRAVWTNPAHKPTVEQGGAHVIAPARSHETVWVDGQGGTAAVPDVMEGWVAALQAGETNIALQQDSGWYDRAQWALEPLLSLPDDVTIGPGYQERLKQAFMSGIALRRETQVKDLALPAIGAPASRRVTAHVAPSLRVEPVPTHYARSAEVYSWLLDHALSRGELPDQAAWADRVAEMRDLYAGAAAISRVDLGLEGAEPEPEPEPEPDGPVDALAGLMMPPLRGPSQGSGEEGPTAHVPAEPVADPPPHVSAATDWIAGWEEDPVLATDVRVMVPVGERPEGGVIAWTVLGVYPVDLVVSYDDLPEVTSLDGSSVDVVGEEARYTVLVPYFTEVDVERPLTRSELREIGDRHPLAEALVQALEASSQPPVR